MTYLTASIDSTSPIPKESGITKAFFNGLLNPSDIQCFPLPDSALDDADIRSLGTRYLEDIKRNSTMLAREQKQTGRTETQSFKIQKSKPIIDQIDAVLATHYGFTDEELDFIVNYDIKYRMGADSEAEE